MSKLNCIRNGGIMYWRSVQVYSGLCFNKSIPTHSLTLKGEVLLYDWAPVSLVWIQPNMYIRMLVISMHQNAWIKQSNRRSAVPAVILSIRYEVSFNVKMRGSMLQTIFLSASVRKISVEEFTLSDQFWVKFRFELSLEFWYFSNITVHHLGWCVYSPSTKELLDHQLSFQLKVRSSFSYHKVVPLVNSMFPYWKVHTLREFL